MSKIDESINSSLAVDEMGLNTRFCLRNDLSSAALSSSTLTHCLIIEMEGEGSPTVLRWALF